MKHRRINQVLRSVLALSLATIPWLVPAQEQDNAAHDWRKANQTVGQFPRGHADVLRWEKAQVPTATIAENAVPDFALPSAADAVHAAWKIHRELATPLARLGDQNVERIATGKWGELDAGLQRIIHGVDEVLEIAANTRKAWISAVAARQTLRHLDDALTAAEAAAELGRRMVSVGNWSRYQQAQVGLGESTARLDLNRARLTSQQAEWALLKSMKLDLQHDRVALPDQLPDAPASPVTEAELRQRLAGIQSNLPLAESRRTGSNAAQAYAAYTASLAAHRTYRDGVLKQRELIGEEILLRYNGMLESVWTLLADVGACSLAVVSAINAQKNALTAEADLQWVLQGGQPGPFVSLGGANQAISAPAGH